MQNQLFKVKEMQGFLKSKGNHSHLLKEMDAFDDQLSALGKKRQQEADKAYQMGFQVLDLAYRQGFKDMNLLQQACTHFIKAMRHQRTDVRPYLALSYLFSLVNNYETAWKYLKAAKDISPGNEVVLNWEDTLRQQEVQHKQRQQHGVPLPGLKTPEGRLTPKQLLESEARLREFLIAQTRQIMEQVAPEPTTDPKQLQQLNLALQNYQRAGEQIEQQLELLAQSPNLEELRRLCQPLEANLKRYRDAIGVSMTLLELLERCKEIGQQVSRLTGEIKQLADAQEIPPVQEQIEALFDQCDLLADHLEHLESQGFDIEPVEPVYEGLTEDVSGVQALLDKTIELFNKLRRQRKAEMPPEPSTNGIKPLFQGLAPNQLAFLAERLWFLLPMSAYDKAAAGLQTFCLRPDKAKVRNIVKELLNSLALGSERAQEAEIFALLAMVFYSHCKPLLAVEYLDYATSLVDDLPQAQRLQSVLAQLNRQSARSSQPKKPMIQGVARLLEANLTPADQVATSLQPLLPPVQHKAGDLYTESLALLCDFCMHPEKGTLLQAADRLLMALASQERSDEVYALLGATFYALGKPLLAQEYLSFAVALQPDLPQVSYVQARVAHLKMPEPAPARPAAAAAPSRRPAAELAMNTLRSPALDIAKLAQTLPGMLNFPGGFPADAGTMQLLRAFCQQPTPNAWGETIHSLSQQIESDAAKAEDFALMGLLLYACGKPLLLLEYLDYARSLKPDSPVIQALVSRFRPQK